MPPEQDARQEIDRLLTAAGWHVCSFKQADIHAARGVAIREFRLGAGHALPFAAAFEQGFVEVTELAEGDSDPEINVDNRYAGKLGDTSIKGHSSNCWRSAT